MHQAMVLEVEMDTASAPSVFAGLLRNVLASLLILLVAVTACVAQDRDNLVETTLKAVVGLRAVVPESARTARSLGTERQGNGIVIDEEGLVLTIGYLIMEASDIEVTDSRGEYVSAEMVAYDYDSGFGLVRAKPPLGIRGMSLGDSSALTPGDPAIIVAHIGPDYLQPAEVVDVREFPGYWEYLLEQAIFTAPPFRGFGGAALVNADGELVGVGSLIVHDAQEGPSPVPGNMFVPVNALKPILDDLLAIGRAGTEPRPWLGLHTEMDRGHLFVLRVSSDGPAESVGIQRNDIIVAVNGKPVSGMADFLRKVWATGPAGVTVRISVMRGGTVREIAVESANRYDWLRLSPGSRYSA